MTKSGQASTPKQWRRHAKAAGGTNSDTHINSALFYSVNCFTYKSSLELFLMHCICLYNVSYALYMLIQCFLCIVYAYTMFLMHCICLYNVSYALYMLIQCFLCIVYAYTMFLMHCICLYNVTRITHECRHPGSITMEPTI